MSNPTFACLGCSQSDDHPKHVIDLDGTNVARWHMDCHAQVTKCELCVSSTEGAEGKTGEALRTHILSKKG